MLYDMLLIHCHLPEKNQPSKHLTEVLSDGLKAQHIWLITGKMNNRASTQQVGVIAL